jgi:hypothetical protein
LPVPEVEAVWLWREDLFFVMTEGRRQKKAIINPEVDIYIIEAYASEPTDTFLGGLLCIGITHLRGTLRNGIVALLGAYRLISVLETCGWQVFV